MTGYFHRWGSFYFGRHNCERYNLGIPGLCDRDWPDCIVLTVALFSCSQRFVPGEGYKTSFRSHVVWAKRRNVNLKELMTQKCLKNTTVVALIVNTDMAILYNPSELGDSIRYGLKTGDFRSLQFWTGISTCISVRKDTICSTYYETYTFHDDEASPNESCFAVLQLCLAVFALVSNYTAYSIFNSLSTENAPIIMRSSVGRYACDLPNDLVNYSIKALFLTAVLSYIEISHPGPPGIVFVVIWILVFLNVLLSAVSFGRTIIRSGAMGVDPILTTGK